jgi:hypothetical protein
VSLRFALKNLRLQRRAHEIEKIIIRYCSFYLPQSRRVVGRTV